MPITDIDSLYEATTFGAPESVQSFASVVEWVDRHRQEAGDTQVMMERAKQAQSIIRQPRTLVIGETQAFQVWNSLGCTCTAFHTKHFDTIAIKDYAQKGISAVLERMQRAKAQGIPYDILFLHEHFAYNRHGKIVAEQFPECIPMLCLTYTEDPDALKNLLQRKDVITCMAMVDNPVLDMVLALNFGKDRLRPLSREPVAAQPQVPVVRQKLSQDQPRLS